MLIEEEEEGGKEGRGEKYLLARRSLRTKDLRSQSAICESSIERPIKSAIKVLRDEFGRWFLSADRVSTRMASLRRVS